jgi:MoxR-like ATPase
LSFRRIQITPDMMPSDITGTDILQDDPETGRRHFAFIHGPLFANIILADEINRTPPKTQAALLEAMQERHVTAYGRTYPLPDPFFVLATQNPIEQEGTYPLPEAQLDRFTLNLRVPYPTAAEELEIRRQTTGESMATPEVVLSAEQIVKFQTLVRREPVAEHVFAYARDLVRASRPGQDEGTDYVRKYVSCGAGPRAGARPAFSLEIPVQRAHPPGRQNDAVGLECPGSVTAFLESQGVGVGSGRRDRRRGQGGLRRPTARRRTGN